MVLSQILRVKAPQSWVGCFKGNLSGMCQTVPKSEEGSFCICYSVNNVIQLYSFVLSFLTFISLVYDCFLLPFLSLFLTFLPSLSSFCSSLFPLPLPLSLFSVMRKCHNFLHFLFFIHFLPHETQRRGWHLLVPCLGPPHFATLPAAAAKSLKSCPTLWDPIDGSPLGSSVSGILQARVLEWVAIAFFSHTN